MFNKEATQSYLPSPALQLFDKQVRQRYLPSPTLQLLEPVVQQTGKAELSTLTCIATVGASCSTNRQGRATYPHLHCNCWSQVFNKQASQSYLPSPALQLLEPGVQQTGKPELPTLTCIATVGARCSTNRQGRATYPHLHCNCWSQVFNKQASQSYLPSPALQLLEPGVQHTGKAELPTLTCTATV